MKKTLVAASVLGALAGSAMAADSYKGVAENTIPSESYIIENVTEQENFGTTEAPLNGLYGIHTNGFNTQFTGSEIKVDVNATGKTYEGKPLGAYGVWANGGSKLTIGNETADINLSATSDTSVRTVTSTDSSSEVIVKGKTISISANSNSADSRAVVARDGGKITLGTDNTDKVVINSYGTGNSNIGITALNAGSSVTVNTKELVINTTGNYALHVQSGTEEAVRPENPATVIVNAENTSITAEHGAGIMAFSNGYMEVNGNLTVKAQSAIDTRGNATIKINKDGKGKVVLDGDIVFETPNSPGDAQNSGKIIDSDVNINLTGEGSSWTGRAYQYYKIDGKFIESIELEEEPYYGNVTGFSLNISDGAVWNMTGDSFINQTTVGEGGEIVATKDVQKLNAEKINLSGGTLSLQHSSQNINVGELTGTGGTINAAVTNTDGVLSSAQISVKKITQSSDQSAPSFAINYTGITSDDLTEENVQGLKALTGEAVGGEESQLQTVETVKEGDLKGDWTRYNGEDAGSYTENTKLADFSSISAMSLVQWRNEINHLTKRLGDIRASESTIGAWARVYGGSSEWGENSVIEMDHTTIQVGGDYRVNPNWIVGAAFSYTDSDADLVNGQAEGESYSLAAYATYMADNGSYLDMIARYGYLKNDITAGNMILDTSNNAFSVSLEGGHMFRFMEDRAYIEPQVELTYGFVAGDDTTAANDVRVEQDDYQNLITRVGVRTGFDFPEKAGTIYAMLSYSYDFLGDADGTASGTTGNGFESVALREDLGGGWVSYGVGAQFRLGDNAFAYGELERTSGGDVDNPYLFNVGFRYNF